MDDIAEIHADPELHAPIRVNARVPLSHGLLDGHCAFDGNYDAPELRKDTVTGRVDDPTSMISDHGQDNRLMRLQVANRSGVVGTHERAIAGDVGGEDGG
jgi:hypothetical protein